MRRIIFSIVLAASLALPPLAWADFTGEVVGVADGDTITVLRDNKQVKVRLAEIDAPEKAQPFGSKSKQALSVLVHGKAVLVVEQGHDRYKRIIGRVYQGNVDVSAEQFKQGMAWVYRKYSKDKTLLPLENEAKALRLGLWADDEPVPPWEWRHTSH
ncbi:MAG: thermonuclease family protein [Candidatus Nitrotoga sp.]